jgi:tetratricopeptide (TPR) repeat protein
MGYVFLRRSNVFAYCVLSSAIISADIHTHTLCAQDYIHLGRQKTAEGNVAEAAELYKKAVALDPSSYVAYFYLGNSAFQQGDVDAASTYYTHAATLNPHSSDILCNLGVCANTRDDVDAAIAYFSKAIDVDPMHSLAYVQRALLREKQERYDEALRDLKKAHELEPANSEMVVCIGTMLKKAERFDEAVPFYRAACRLKPDDNNLAAELANVLAFTNQNQEALDLYYTVLEKNPTLTSTLLNFGFLLKKVGRLDLAIEMYKRAIQQRPDYALAHFDLAIAYLTRGDFDHGWLEYEWRWAAYDTKPQTFNQPHWDGSDLNGKRIYIYAEQGLGDALQFMRYLRLLKQQGAHITLLAHAPLKQLLQLCPYIDTVLIPHDALPDFDYHVSLLSLPLMFNTRIDTIPAEIPYLYADETLVREWATRLAGDTQFKVGICWQGNTHYEESFLQRAVALKSCDLTLFEILASVPGVSLYSLQKVDGTDQCAALASYAWVHTFDNTSFDEQHGRFMDTAALIQNLDLVISVDTAVAHCAAALGAQTWILLPKVADWRWLQARVDTPWYPNVRLFRQQTEGDWRSVMQSVATELKTYAQSIQRTKAVGIVNQQLTNYIATIHADTTPGVDHTAELALAYAIKYDLAHVSF